jgi:hypothetical protein
VESLLDSEKFDAVGLAYALLWLENVGAAEDCNGVMYGGGAWPGTPAKGLPPEGVDNRRLGGGGPAQDTGREEVDTGDCIVDPNWAGLPAAAEKVADCGVVGAFDCVSYSTICGPGLPIKGGLYASIVFSVRRARAEPSLAMARGGGLRRTSGDCATLILDMPVVMLEAEMFLLWPLLWPPVLPRVFALERFPGGLTRSVRICL